jgi:hypothetical protein
MGPLFDPVGQIIIPVRTDAISLGLKDVDLQPALYQVIYDSGFVVVAATDVTGKVTVQAEDAPLGDTLDQLAAGVGAKCRAVYVLSRPRQLTQAEVDGRMEQAFQSRMAAFWNSTPEERAQQVQRMVDGIGRFADMATQAGADGQANPASRMLQNFAPRMLSRLAGYSAGLDPTRRAELKPILKALGDAINRR